MDTSAPEPEVDDGPMTLAEAKKLRRENQSLRTRLHESEEQIGAAAAREAARDRAEAERIASEHLVDATESGVRNPTWRSSTTVSSTKSPVIALSRRRKHWLPKSRIWPSRTPLRHGPIRRH